MAGLASKALEREAASVYSLSFERLCGAEKVVMIFCGY